MRLWFESLCFPSDHDSCRRPFPLLRDGPGGQHNDRTKVVTQIEVWRRIGDPGVPQV